VVVSIIGCDYSHWQGILAHAANAAAGIRFAYQKATHGLGLDPMFLANWRASAGVYERGRGAYHWLTDQDPVYQADFLTRTLEMTGDVGELVPAVDFEEPTTKLRGEPLALHLLKCLRRVRALHGEALHYSGAWYIDQFVGPKVSPELVAELLTYPFWHAEYPRVSIADKRACGSNPPVLPPPRLPYFWRMAGVVEAVRQFDGDGGCVLATGDADFNEATEEGLARFTRVRPVSTLPAPPPDDTAKTMPGTPSAVRESQKMARVDAQIIDDDGTAVTSIRAGEGQKEYVP
jgi:GH25 family lysozyme M1 (1,4-beta-N-acetylmuramidase)